MRKRARRASFETMCIPDIREIVKIIVRCIGYKDVINFLGKVFEIKRMTVNVLYMYLLLPKKIF